jgi:hypothetical protein
MRTKIICLLSLLVAVISVGCGKKETPRGSTSAPERRSFPQVIAFTAETPHQIGKFDSAKQAMVAQQNESAALVFGPYLPLEPGNYRAVFNLSADGHGQESVGKVDFNAFSDAKPDIPVAAADLKPASDKQRVTLDFQSAAGLKYEFRVWANGNGVLSVKDVVLERRG